MVRTKKILIAEDDPASAGYLKIILQESGYEIASVATTGSQAIRQCKSMKPDLVLMDIVLEGKMSGCEAALEIKHSCSDVKIIFLTAYADPEMVDYAVEAEAYGYLMKPYRKEEILATIKLAFSHQSTKKPPLEEMIIPLQNGYVYNTQSNRLLKQNREIPLSKKQLRLLEILAKNRNSSVSNEHICLFVWGENKSACTLRSLIHRFRSVVKDDMIKNVNGVGYEILARNR